MKSDTVKGYSFALVATIAFSNVYIFSKAALNEVHLAQFGIYWFSVSTLLILLYTLYKRKLSQVKFLTKRQIIILITLGLLEILTTTAFFLSIHTIPDPAVTSFLGNMFPVMLAMGGVFILGEKFSPFETAGAVLAFSGTFIISYTGETSLSKLFIPGTGIVLLNAFFATVASLVVKVHVKKMSPELLGLNRSAWLLAFSIVMFFVYRQSLEIPVSALKNIAIGALLGPFLAILSVYYSFSYLEASRSSIVQSLKGIFVLLGAYLFFGTFPLTHQVIGGFVTIGGVVLMTLGKGKIFIRRTS
ncbi:DMT family transporter [Mariniphaga sediminis]|uniref:DMT family transporter n=1 Tax=Mariniphaga sediminis TaxID=1628158 RepID=A0A399D1G7_9BACT|nr:DMT family transporter [Mariniphaga sediminis]RIH65724.1 DMT family transporter [Mariniphaga sediminis]